MVMPRAEGGVARPGPDAATDAATHAVEAWRTVMDGVVQGIAHGLSNRVGTLGALAEALSASDPAAPFPPILAEEVHRLDEALRVLRLLPLDEGRGAEPLRPADAVADAVALFEQHPNGRDARVTVTGGDDAPPVRAHPPSLVHALTVLLVAAAGEAGAPILVEISSDTAGGGERVLFRVDAGGSADSGRLARAAAASAALLEADGGTARWEGDGVALVALPTLATARERDRRGG